MVKNTAKGQNRENELKKERYLESSQMVTAFRFFPYFIFHLWQTCISIRCSSLRRNRKKREAEAITRQFEQQNEAKKKKLTQELPEPRDEFL
jgi:hypothetical protein